MCNINNLCNLPGNIATTQSDYIFFIRLRFPLVYYNNNIACFLIHIWSGIPIKWKRPL